MYHLIQLLWRTDAQISQISRTCSKLSTLHVCNNTHLSICITFWCELVFLYLKGANFGNELGFTATNCSDLGRKKCKGGNLFLQLNLLSMESICITDILGVK